MSNEEISWLRYCLTPPADDEALWEYCKNVFGIQIPRHAVCLDKGHSSPFQAFADSYFARQPVSIWKGARGSGKTFLLALLSLIEMITYKNCDVFLLGGSREQSRKIYDYLKLAAPVNDGLFWAAMKAPRWLIEGKPTQTECKIINGSTLTALTASENSVRGKHGERVRADEVDVMKQLILDGASGIPKQKKNCKALTQVTYSSTHQVVNGTFTKLINDMHEKGIKPYVWCYKETLEPYGWETQDNMDRIKFNTNPYTWFKEFECEQPKEGERIFTKECLDILFDKRLGIYIGDPMEQLRIVKTSSELHFGTGVDWGNTSDWTIMDTLCFIGDDKPAIRAAWGRYGRVAHWDIIGEILDQRLEEYPGTCNHDKTGYGQVVESMLKEPVFGYDFRDTREGIRILLDYIRAVQQGKITGPYIKHAYDEHVDFTVDDLNNAKNGHRPDSVVAAALAWKAREGNGSLKIWRPSSGVSRPYRVGPVAPNYRVRN